jgi:hypothetical protein
MRLNQNHLGKSEEISVNSAFALRFFWYDWIDPSKRFLRARTSWGLLNSSQVGCEDATVTRRCFETACDLIRMSFCLTRSLHVRGSGDAAYPAPQLSETINT